MNNWIKVTDKLPEYSGYYLVAFTNNSQSVTRAYFLDEENGFKHVFTKRNFITVTHWQRMPEPPNYF